ncbi:MAG TPA: porin family protein [Rhodospirillales bacterium]|nr:porin family protein [Rhodospirillales bacterium]
MKLLNKAIIGGAIFSLSTVVCAQNYVGIGLGKVDIDEEGFDNPRGFEMFVGHDYSENISLEGSYVDFGDAKDNIAPVWTISGDSLSLAVLAKAPISEELTVFAKVGMHFWDAQLDEAGFGTLLSDDGSDLLFGFGADYKANDSVSVGARYTRYNFDFDSETSSDVSIFSVNVAFRLK